MTPDLYFDSAWDIDQILMQGEVSFVAAANTDFPAVTSLLVDHNLGYVPVVDFTWQLDNTGGWHQPGGLGSTVTCWYLMDTESVSVLLENFDSQDHSVNVRYKIWTDKVTY